jgi:hypothetical protein
MPDRITKTMLDRVKVPDGWSRRRIFDSGLPAFGLAAPPSGICIFLQYRPGSGCAAAKRRQILGQHRALTVVGARAPLPFSSARC